MTAITNAPDTLTRPQVRDCSTSGNVTRSLLGYLALAGPFYVVLSVAQGLTRSGFSLARHEWSLLALGHLGWIQTLNLILTGLMTVVGAVGVRRVLPRTAVAGTWAPRLLAGYGVALVGAALFRADPANGFPAGAPTGGSAPLSWHGTLHVMAGSIGFACLIAACFVVARSYAGRGQGRAALVSRVIGAVFAVAFAGIATGSRSVAVNLAFTLAVVASYAWLSAVAVDLYQRTRLQAPDLATTPQ